MSCGLTLLGGILGLLAGPILGMLLADLLSGELLGGPRAEAGFGGFLYGLFFGPFVGMVALPLLVSLGQSLLRRRGGGMGSGL